MQWLSACSVMPPPIMVARIVLLGAYALRLFSDRGQTPFLFMQVSSPESSYEGDGDAEKAMGEDLLKHLGEKITHTPGLVYLVAACH